MATSSIFLHIAIIDLSGKVRDPIKSSHIQIPHLCGISPFCSFTKQIKPGNAVQVARKHIQKAAQKHLKSHQKQPSVDFSVLSSEDGRGVGYRKDLDTMSQDSRNGEMFWPLAKAAAYKGAMSEPVRRAHRVKIHDPPETRRGIFSRMSSTDSHHMSSPPSMKDDSFDFDFPPQTSCINGPAPGSQNLPIQEEFENEHNESALLTCAEQETDRTREPERPEQCQEEPQMRAGATQPEVETDPAPQPQPVPHPQIQPEVKSPPLIPPSSPARVRRTLGTPVHPLPSTPVRTKVRSHSCPRKQTSIAQTPTALRRHAYRLQTQASLRYGSSGSQVKPIPNGLCLSDSTSSSSDVSTDSQEITPSSGQEGAEQREGTLQREMKALFDQRLREIRCKSPLFFLNGESGDSHLQEENK